MWIFSILFLPFLIYGLWTGRVWAGGHGFSRTYSRQSEPRWYWGVVGMYSFFVGLGIVVSLKPSLADAADNILTAFALGGVVVLLAVVAYEAIFQRDND